jgi:hypothetical protein
VTVVGRVNALLVAPGASAAESALTYGTAGAGAGLATIGAVHAGLAPLSVFVLAVVAFDLIGGAVVNATAAAKQRFHRPGRRGRLLGFVAGHVHPLVLALLVPGFGWTPGALAYGLAVAGALAVLAVDPLIRRPLAFAITVLGSAAALVIAPVPAFLAWVTPALLVKLLLGHLLPEEAR